MRIMRALRAMMSNRNWVTISPEESNPRRGMIGIFAIVIGVLNGLRISGFLYLSQMAEKFTNAKMVNVPKFVISATNPMFPIKTKTHGKTITIRIPTQGVPLRESLERLRGNEPSLAIPYIILEPTIKRINTVFAVANKAITDMAKKAPCPSDLEAANASGQQDAPSSCQLTMLTDETATKTYKIAVTTTEMIKAFGMFRSGRFTSSARFTMSSKPRYAKKINVLAFSIP